MHYLLHIDTSTDTGTVAISADGKLVSSRTNAETRNHAATINIMINEALADAHINMQQLSAVVVCAGPGSYTGLRIGMATAKGLCYALNIPLLLDNRLTLLSYDACEKFPDAGQYISILLAREKEYFVATYSGTDKCTFGPQHIIEEELNTLPQPAGKCVLITNVPDISMTLVINDLQIITDTNVNYELWAKMAYEHYKCNDIVNLATAEPFYLKQVFTHN